MRTLSPRPLSAFVNSMTRGLLFMCFAMTAIACGSNSDGTGDPPLVPTGFTVSLSPSALTVAAGSSGSVTATIARAGGLTSTVNLSADGFPAGVTATFSQPSVSTSVTSTTLSVVAASTTVPGTYAFTIHGSATGATDVAATVSMTVLAQPAFALAVNPSSLNVQAGTTGRTVAQLVRTNFPDAVTLAVEGAPAGVTTAIVTPSLANDTTSINAVVATTVTPGAYNLTLRARSSLTDRTVPITLVVTAPPDFAIASSVSTLSVQQGQVTTPSTISITRSGGFTGAVDLTVTGLPSGVTATFGTSSVAGASTTLTLSATSTAAVGTANVVVHANAGTLAERTATIALTVTPTVGGFTLTLSPATLLVPQLGTANVTVSIVRTAPFTGPVTLSLTGAGTGLTTTINSATIAAGATSTTITVSAAILAPTVTTQFALHSVGMGVPNQDVPLAVTVQPSQASLISQHILVQEGLGMALSFSVLQGQIQVISQANAHGFGSAKLCTTMPGSGSVQSLPIGQDNSTRMGFYFDQTCTKPYILSDITSYTEDVNHLVDVVGTARYFKLDGTPLGTLVMQNQAQVTLPTNQFITGVGIFTPAIGTAPLTIGLSCLVQTAGQSSVPCSGGVTQNLTSLGIAIGSITPLTLNVTTLDAPMTFTGNSSVLMTGTTNSLTLTAPTHSTLAIAGGPVWGTSTQVGGTGTFSLFPALPAGWTITDTQHDMKFAIDFVDSATGNSTGTVKVISTGVTLATVSVDGTGTGTVAWSDGNVVAVNGWALAN